jgi:hypothetical protein
MARDQQTTGVAHDEASMRRLYGEGAQFSYVGRFTLVHLDDPGEEEMARRVAEFKPEDFLEPDCPLCAMALAEGGHIVYDGYDDKDSVDPVTDLAVALDGLQTAIGDLTAIAAGLPEPLAGRYATTVAALPGRLRELLFDEETSTPIVGVTESIDACRAVVADVVATEVGAEAPGGAVLDALTELAACWDRI